MTTNSTKQLYCSVCLSKDHVPLHLNKLQLIEPCNCNIFVHRQCFDKNKKSYDPYSLQCCDVCCKNYDYEYSYSNCSLVSRICKSIVSIVCFNLLTFLFFLLALVSSFYTVTSIATITNSILLILIIVTITSVYSVVIFILCCLIDQIYKIVKCDKKIKFPYLLYLLNYRNKNSVNACFNFFNYFSSDIFKIVECTTDCQESVCVIVYIIAVFLMIVLLPFIVFVAVLKISFYHYKNIYKNCFYGTIVSKNCVYRV